MKSRITDSTNIEINQFKRDNNTVLIYWDELNGYREILFNYVLVLAYDPNNSKRNWITEDASKLFAVIETMIYF